MLALQRANSIQRVSTTRTSRASGLGISCNGTFGSVATFIGPRLLYGRHVGTLCRWRTGDLSGGCTVKSKNMWISNTYSVRHLTTLPPRTTSRLSAEHKIYISTSSNPYFNLTLEDWLFRTAPSNDPLLLIYRDAPCVVIGRNQNPWTEVNFTALGKREQEGNGIPFIRRRSGGGTVFHDLGNTNFSIHLPRTSFDRHATAQIVLRAVRALGIADARVNERNDICVGENKMSGSAYKIVNKRAYHHGTMLISTQLDTLGDLLRTSKETMITKGVASVRSPVCNLQQFSSTITHESFARAVVTEFRKEYGVDEPACTVDDTEEMRNLEYIRRGMEELPSWDWAYGQTPEFTYTISHTFAWGDVIAEIRAKHGVILACVFQLDNVHIQGAAKDAIISLGRSLEGQRYGFIDEEVAAHEKGPTAEVKTWLWGAMA